MLNPTSAPGQLRAAAAWLALLLLATYGYFMPAPASNEISRFSLVRSLVERGRIDIDPYAETTPDVARFGDHVYSDKAPGSALLAAPGYAIYAGIVRRTGAAGPAFARESQLRGQPVQGEDRLFFNPAFRRGVYVSNLVTNALAGAALGGLLLLVLAGWGVAPRRALAVAVALGAGSLIFAYSTMFFGHVLAAAGLFAAFALLDRGERGPPGGWPRAGLAAAGLLAGVAVLVELPAALGAAVLAAHLVTRPGQTPRDRLRGLGWFVAGAAPPLLALAAYQSAAFGGPLSSGYAHVSNPTFAAGMSQGVLGVGWPRPSVLLAMFFGRARGLFYVAPVLLLAAWGLGRGLRQPATRRRALTALAMLVAFALMNAGYYMWWGGAALGPRHIIPALPFLALGLAWLPWTSRGCRLLFALLLALSLSNQLAAVAVSPLADVTVDVLFGHTYPALLRNQVAILPGAANLGMLLGLRGVVSLMPLLGLWGLGIATIVAALPRTDPARGT